eukprot:scaffold1168_cov167-Amphora_coffeaeformis.AAC.27
MQLLAFFLIFSLPLDCLSFAPTSRQGLTRRTASRYTILPHAAAKKDLSAAERERRDEERRRQERTQDVVIGKTSALRDATDFALNVKATEEEWMRQASEEEQEVYRHTEKGMIALKMLDVEQASESFDRVFQLRPSAYLWQAGIAKFYLNELEEAAEIFAKSALIFESKFGEPASEERIWRNACELKLISSLDKKERKRIQRQGGIDLPNIPSNDYTAELLASERRKAVKTARDLFDATVANDYSATILAKAKLRSCGGAFEKSPRLDIKMWKLNSWFYLGLYYDAIGDEEEGKKCMKMALRLRPSAGNASDIIHTLPMLHMSQRDWFDDEAIDADLADEPENDTPTSAKSAAYSRLAIEKKEPDPLVLRTVRDGVAKLKITELRDALKVRGLKGTGSKEELGERLFESLMEDAGLAP